MKKKNHGMFLYISAKNGNLRVRHFHCNFFLYTYIVWIFLSLTSNELELRYIIMYFLKIFFGLRGRFPSLPRVLHYYTMILQRSRIIVGDAGFVPGTFAPEVWCTTNEPPQLHIIVFNILYDKYDLVTSE